MDLDALPRRRNWTARRVHRTSMRPCKHDFGGHRIIGQNLVSESQGSIRKCCPNGLGILLDLVTPVQCDTPWENELNVRTLIIEISLHVPGINGCYVPVKDLLRARHFHIPFVNVFDIMAAMRSPPP